MKTLYLHGRFQPPSLSKVVHKTHLLSFLETRKERKLFLVHGKAGQGKSTVIADFLDRSEWESCWYRLHEDDSDIGKLIYHLAAAARNTFPELCESTAEHEPQESMEDLLQLLNAIRSDHYYFVIDDFHLLQSDSASCELITLLTENLPAGMHMIIISRTVPDLKCRRFSFGKDVVEVKERDLVFTIEEARKLFKDSYGLSIQDTVLERIMVITRGWVTGITIILEHLGKLDLDSRNDFIESFFKYKQLQSLDNYFSGEVMARLEPEYSSLLVISSIFDEITPQLLDGLSGMDGASAIRELQSRNLFIDSESEQQKRFSFNPLFLTFLRKEFEDFPEDEKKAAHGVIADLLQANGENEKAIVHYTLADTPEKGKYLFYDLADTLLAHSQHEVIETLLSCFTPDVIDQDPLLAYYHGLVTNLLKPYSSRERLLALLSHFRNSHDVLREARVYTELLTNYFFYLESSDTIASLLKKSRAFLDQAGEELPPDRREILSALITLGQWWENPGSEEPYNIALKAEETSFKFQNEEAFLCSRLVLARIYISRGEFNEAVRLLEKTEKIVGPGSFNHPYLGLIRFFIGDTRFYLGEIEKAIAQTEQALTGSPEGFAFRTYLELNLVTYFLYTDEYEKAEQIYDGERIKAIGENLYLQYFWIYYLPMMIAYRNNNIRRAEYYCRRLMDEENRRLLKTDYPFSYVAIAEVCIFIGDFTSAEQYARNILDTSDEGINPYSHATAYALLGHMYSTTNNKTEAGKTFEKMTDILQEKNFRNLDICSPQLLREITRQCGEDLFTSFPRLQGQNAVTSPAGIEQSHELEFKTLGTFQIFVHGTETQKAILARQKRVLDLLKLLIVFRENGISKEVIYETFWPRYSYKSARDNLNTLVYRLRKIFGEGTDFISTDMNIIRLKEGTYTTDVDQFIQFINRGKVAEGRKEKHVAIECYSQAAALYGGDFLESGLYLDHIRDERENMRNRYREILFTLVKLSLDEKDFHGSLSWAKKLISHDPLCEPAYRLLMIASVVSGNRSELNRIYNQLKRNLEEQYDIAPDTKTESLKTALLAGKSPEPGMWQEEAII